MSKAQGQFTIIDYNDALTLTGYIGSNLAKTQMFNPDNNTYTPSWVSTNLVLTPSLYVIGTTTDQITSSAVTSVKWYQGTSTTAITTGGNYALSGTKNHILTIKANIMAGLPGVDFRCEITYKDSSTGLSLTHPLSISFSRVVNGGGIVDLLVTTPSGNVFKNSEVATITIYAAAVESYAVFKCCATDTDSASNTYNSKFFDVATFIDNADPIQVVITSTGGDVFKNGQGSTTLTATVYQAGTEIDTTGDGTYTWTKYNKDGAIDTSWGTSGHKTGKNLSVSTSDVTTKATFMVEVTI